MQRFTLKDGKMEWRFFPCVCTVNSVYVISIVLDYTNMFYEIIVLLLIVYNNFL